MEQFIFLIVLFFILVLLFHIKGKINSSKTEIVYHLLKKENRDEEQESSDDYVESPPISEGDYYDDNGIARTADGNIITGPQRFIDAREPFCPNCGVHLDKIPDRRVRCSECGDYIYSYAVDEGVYTRVKRLTSEKDGKAHYKKQRENAEAYRILTSSPEYINEEIDKIRDQGFTRVQISGCGCAMCRSKMGKVLSIQAARNMIGKPLSKKCECPYFFSPDMSSRDYSKLF